MIGFVKTTLLNAPRNTKSNPDFEITVYKSIKDLSSDDNATLSSSNDKNLLNQEYLSVFEHQISSGIKPVYIKTTDRVTGKVHMLYAQIYQFESAHFSALNKKDEAHKCSYKDVVSSMFLKALNCLQCNVLVFGNLFYSGAVQTLPLKIIESINDDLKALLAIDCVVLKDMVDPLINYQKKYYRVPAQPAMYLTLQPNWTNIDDYIEALQPKYRKRWNNTNNKNNALQVKLLTNEVFDTHQDLMYKLYESVFNKSETLYNKIQSGYFKTIKENLKEDYNAIGIFEGEKLVAFVTYYRKNENLVAEFVGYELSKNKTLKLYQTLLYQLVEQGIKHKAAQIEFGRTGLEIKSTLGALPQLFHSYLRFNNKFIHKQVADVMHNLQDEVWTPRSPFK